MKKDQISIYTSEKRTTIFGIRPSSAHLSPKEVYQTEEQNVFTDSKMSHAEHILKQAACSKLLELGGCTVGVHGEKADPSIIDISARVDTTELNQLSVVVSSDLGW